MTPKGQDNGQVKKLLTYVFDIRAPLPQVDVPFELADGLFLARCPQFLLEQDQESQVLKIDPSFSSLFRDSLHQTTLNIEYNGRGDLNDEGVKSAEHQCKTTANNYLLAVMVFTTQIASPFAAFVTVPSERRVCHSLSMRSFAPLQWELNNNLSNADFTKINELFHSVKQVLRDGAVGRLPTALRYYHQAFRVDIDWSLRFLGMMMAMEALFGHGATEIAHQVSERTAFFLQSSTDSRKELYSAMKKHYRLRSQIAHGGEPKIKGNFEESFKSLAGILKDSLCRILLTQDLLQLFTANDNGQFEDAMQNLIFCGSPIVDYHPSVAD